MQEFEHLGLSLEWTAQVLASQGVRGDLKCPSCGQEVLLAQVCPYCGAKVDQNKQLDHPDIEDETAGKSERSESRGTFRGTLEGENGSSRPFASGWSDRGTQPFTLKGSILALGRYLFDRRVPLSRKLWILAAILYILSPIDLIPGGVLPIIGWFDDLAVMGLLWGYVNSELRRYRR